MINGIIATATAISLIVFIMLGMYLHSWILNTDRGCNGTDNYRFVGLKNHMTEQEVIAKYGEFDKRFEREIYSDGSVSPWYDVAYRVSPVEAGYRYTEYPVYLVLTFKDNKGLVGCRQEVHIE